MSNKIIWLDCETTGLDKDKNGIITLAVMIEIDGEIKEERTFEMNPVGRAIEDGALQVNGITREQVASFPEWGMVRQEFIKLMSKYIDKFAKLDKFTVAGYNIITFDLGFIESWFNQFGDKYLYSWFNRIPLDVYRALPMFEYAGRFTPGENRKLGSVAEVLGVKLEDVHEAMADVKATREIAKKLAAMF